MAENDKEHGADDKHQRDARGWKVSAEEWKAAAGIIETKSADADKNGQSPIKGGITEVNETGNHAAVLAAMFASSKPKSIEPKKTDDGWRKVAEGYGAAADANFAEKFKTPKEDKGPSR